MNWIWEKQDSRFKKVNPVLEQMISGACEIVTGLWEQTPDYLPFHDCETASVSILAAGLARKGAFPVCEYPVDKKKWEAVYKKAGKNVSDLKDKHLTSGRADLCVLFEGSYYSFEFKQSSERWRVPFGPKRLDTNLEYLKDYALEEISRVDDDEYHRILAGLIVPVYEDTDTSVIKEHIGQSSLALRIGSKRSFKVYFLFYSLSHFKA